MTTIGDRIKEAIDYMSTGKIEQALTAVCIAIDVTSKKVERVSKSSKSNYKKFLSDYMWLITYIGLPGIISSAIKVPFSHPDIKTDTNGFCALEDIIYSAVRCELIHSEGLRSNIIWSRNIVVGVEEISGNLQLSENLIWGLIGAVIFCPENKDCKIENEFYWLSINTFKYFISDLWGRIDIPERIIKMHSGNIVS